MCGGELRWCGGRSSDDRRRPRLSVVSVFSVFLLRCILCTGVDLRTWSGRTLVADGRGFIIPVGGAEEKIGDVTILRRFASLCGNECRIAIIPTASELTDTG